MELKKSSERRLCFGFLAVFLLFKLVNLALMPGLHGCSEDCNAAELFWQNGGLPDFMKSPAYTFFAILSHSVFGIETFGSKLFMVVVHILSTIIGAWLVFEMGLLLFGGLAGLAAAAFFILDPLLFHFTYFLHSEGLFIGFFCAALYFALRLVGAVRDSKKDVLKWGLLCGLFLALSTHIRPVTYYLVIGVTLGTLLYHGFGSRKRVASVKLGLVLLLPSLVLIGGWQIRNYLASGYGDFSHVKQENIYNYRAALTVGEREGLDLEEARAYLNERNPRPEDLSRTELLSFYETNGWRVIRENPGYYVVAQLKALARMLFGPGLTAFVEYYDATELLFRETATRNPVTKYLEWKSEYPSVVLAQYLSMFFLGLLYFFLAIGVWRLFQTRQIFKMEHLFLGLVFLYFLLASGPEAYSRFRIPVLPILCLYASMGASMGVVWGGQWLRQKR